MYICVFKTLIIMQQKDHNDDLYNILIQSEPIQSRVRPTRDIENRVKNLKLYLTTLEEKPLKERSSAVNFALFEIEILEDILIVYRHFSFYENDILKFLQNQFRRVYRVIFLNDVRGYGLKCKNEERYLIVLNYLLAPSEVERLKAEFEAKPLKAVQMMM